MKYLIFIRTLPEKIRPNLSPSLQDFSVHQPFRWIVQLHYGEQPLHYEISRIAGSGDFELGFHCESRDKELNRYLLRGFRRHLFEIRDKLGDQIEAEMWDRGWTKIYERFPADNLDESYQRRLGRRMARLMTVIQPIFISIRYEQPTSNGQGNKGKMK